MRSIDMNRNLSDRLWKTETESKIEATPLDKQQILAELAYVLQPLIHISSIGIFGMKSWKPWALSAICDVFR